MPEPPPRARPPPQRSAPPGPAESLLRTALRIPYFDRPAPCYRWIQIETESRNPLQRESVEMNDRVRGIRSTDTADFVVSGERDRPPRGPHGIRGVDAG